MVARRHRFTRTDPPFTDGPGPDVVAGPRATTGYVMFDPLSPGTRGFRRVLSGRTYVIRRCADVGIPAGPVGGPIRADRPDGTTDVAMSPHGDRFTAIVARDTAMDDSPPIGDRAAAIARTAAAYAAARRSPTVWDVDIAAAIGFPWSPDGAAACRAAYGVPVRIIAAVWPSTKTDPRFAASAARFIGGIVDPATGRVCDAIDGPAIDRVTA